MFTWQSTATTLWPWWSSKMIKTSCGGGTFLVWCRWWSLQGPHEFHFPKHSVYLLVLPQDISIACLKVAHLTDISNVRDALRWRWVCIGITFILQKYSRNVYRSAWCCEYGNVFVLIFIIVMNSCLYCTYWSTTSKYIDHGMDTWVETAHWISDNTHHASYCMVKPATPATAKTAK